jgi:hypothetical protein
MERLWKKGKETVYKIFIFHSLAKLGANLTQRSREKHVTVDFSARTVVKSPGVLT